MRLFRWLGVLVAVVMAAGMCAQEGAKGSKIYIIDGYFFHEIPMDHSLLDGLLSIRTANGTKAFGLTLKEPLPEEAKQYAVPKEQIPELSKWKEEMPDVMFFSSTYEKPETARPVLERAGFNWIPLVNNTQFIEYIGGNGYPMTIVVGKDGKIVQIEYGTSPLQRDSLKETIRSLR